MANSPQPEPVPREPETEKGQPVRSQYLTFAQTLLNGSKLNYLKLYQQYAIAPDDAQVLDQSLS